MRGTRRGKQKGVGASPEMVSGTLPLVRQFGSIRDELITYMVCIHESDSYKYVFAFNRKYFMANF